MSPSQPSPEGRALIESYINHFPVEKDFKNKKVKVSPTGGDYSHLFAFLRCS